ncbi:MAG: hypothetical protein ACLFV3_09335 [Phycisphaeraceae bacterium]
MAKYRNIHGRKQTRGWRPVLLIGKVLSYILLMGGLACVVVLLSGSNADLLPPPRLLHQLRQLYAFIIIPGSTAAILFGILLVIEAGPRVMLRLRWLQVKLAMVFLGLPALHLVSAWQIHRWKEYAEDLQAPALGLTPLPTKILFWTSLAGLAWLVLIVILGRIKPRLRQNWAAAYRKIQPTRETGDDE